MSPSPMPIRTCTPVIAASTPPSGRSTLPPNAKASTKADDASGTESPLPSCDGGVVLSLFPDKFELRDVRCDDVVFQAFLSLRSFHEHKATLEDAAIGSIHPIP